MNFPSTGNSSSGDGGKWVPLSGTINGTLFSCRRERLSPSSAFPEEACPSPKPIPCNGRIFRVFHSQVKNLH